MPDPKAKTRWLNVFIVGVGLLGFFLRISLYVDNRSFWIDEAMLALNIVGRSFIDLLKPLVRTAIAVSKETQGIREYRCVFP